MAVFIFMHLFGNEFFIYPADRRWEWSEMIPNCLSDWPGRIYHEIFLAFLVTSGSRRGSPVRNSPALGALWESSGLSIAFFLSLSLLKGRGRFHLSILSTCFSQRPTYLRAFHTHIYTRKYSAVLSLLLPRFIDDNLWIEHPVKIRYFFERYL